MLNPQIEWINFLQLVRQVRQHLKNNRVRVWTRLRSEKKYATKGERRMVEFRASADIRLENLTELICGLYVSK